MDELALQQIIVQQGSIVFNDFERIKQQATVLAENIKNVEVNEENIKQSKKMLAAVNNRIKDLESKRIEIKKTMLEPYTDFESKVREIVQIVKDADDFVRQQVKELEEIERQQKHDHLEEIFEKRIKHYSFRDLFGFKDFLQPKHLNKTASIEATEKEMVLFLEKLTQDMKVIENMPNAQEVLSAYIDTKDLAAALSIIQAQEQRRKAIEASRAIDKNARSSFIFEVYDQKDFKIVQLYMQQENIKFKVRDF